MQLHVKKCHTKQFLPKLSSSWWFSVKAGLTQWLFEVYFLSDLGRGLLESTDIKIFFQLTMLISEILKSSQQAPGLIITQMQRSISYDRCCVVHIAGALPGVLGSSSPCLCFPPLAWMCLCFRWPKADPLGATSPPWMCRELELPGPVGPTPTLLPAGS